VIPVVLALVSALVYGTADFSGGTASRRSSANATLMVSLPAGFVLLLALALPAGGPTVHGLIWGAVSGLAGGLGMITFYQGLAIGPMSVVAPLSAVVSAALPVGAGVAWGERISLVIVIGLGLCLIAIVLVSLSGGDGTGRRGLAGSGPILGLISGVGFGAFFVLLRVAEEGGGAAPALWALAASKGAGWVILSATLLVARRSLKPPADRTTLAIAVLAGVLDVTANGIYLVAAASGKLAVVGAVTSLYPASTVLLARLIHGERLLLVQRVGLAVAAIGVVLVSTG
jgi:uncharacterized membrane protein